MTHHDRVLTMIATLLVFTIDEVHLSRARPRVLDAAHGFTHPATVRAGGGISEVFLSGPDLALRWGLALLVVSCALWVVGASLRKEVSSSA